MLRFTARRGSASVVGFLRYGASGRGLARRSTFAHGALFSSHGPHHNSALKRTSVLLCNSNSNSSNTHDDADDGNEGVTIFCPDSGLSPEEVERKRKTDAFVRAVLTTADEQEWRDMLSAALRLGVWREHHLQAVLRGVKLNKYNGPIVSIDDDIKSNTSTHSARDGGGTTVDGPSPADATIASSSSPSPLRHSTPMQRLERAKNILVFTEEEAPAYPSPPSNDQSTDASNASEAEDNITTTSVSSRRGYYRPSDASVHTLLTLLLSGAQHHHSNSGEPGERADAIPHALYRDVWAFLSWMELSDYHVQSFTVLSELEAAIDLDEGNDHNSSSSGGSGSLHQLQSPSSSSSAAPPLRYALVSRRINRLEFVRSEREWLQERGLGTGTAASGGGEGGVAGHSSGAARRRHVDISRTELK